MSYSSTPSPAKPCCSGCSAGASKCGGGIGDAAPVDPIAQIPGVAPDWKPSDSSNTYVLIGLVALGVFIATRKPKSRSRR